MSMMWSNLSHVMTLMICGHTCCMYSQLSHMVTLVTPGHTGHMWSHISHVVNLVTCGHNFHICQKLKIVQKRQKSALIDLTAAPKVKSPYTFLILFQSSECHLGAKCKFRTNYFHHLRFIYWYIMDLSSINVFICFLISVGIPG